MSELPRTQLYTTVCVIALVLYTGAPRASRSRPHSRRRAGVEVSDGTVGEEGCRRCLSVPAGARVAPRGKPSRLGRRLLRHPDKP